MSQKCGRDKLGKGKPKETMRTTFLIFQMAWLFGPCGLCDLW